MKNNSKLYFLIIPFLFIILFVACQTLKIDPLVETAKTCSSLQAQPIPNQYIIYFPDFERQNNTKKNTNKGKELAKERRELIDSIITISNGSVFLKRRFCQQIYLMELENEVEFEERVAEARGSIAPSGGSVTPNFNLEIGPLGGLKNSSSSLPTNFVPQIDQVSLPLKVKVAITDTGFEPLVPLFNNKLWINTSEETGIPNLDDDFNCIDDDINGANLFLINNDIWPTDDHGTAVASKVAGFPIGGYPDTIQLQLMNVKFNNLDKATLFSAICALQYAIDNGANVIVASWGLYHKLDSTLSPLKNIVKLANQRNVTLIAAAGNDTVNIDRCSFFSASFAGIEGFEHVISVGAAYNTSAINGLASFSNFGKESVLLVAPGVDVPVLERNGIAGSMNGTSLAAPIIARTVSIIKALRPGITHGELRECLLQSTDDMPFVTGVKIKSGLLNHNAAITECTP